jgi:hypothetical protein
LTYCCDGTVKRNVYVGVPQGLLLGPLLWNLVYDGLLRLLDPVKDVDAVAFAGDLVLVIAMRKSQSSFRGPFECYILVYILCKFYISIFVKNLAIKICLKYVMSIKI